MASALIGHTGFVGGNILRQARFDDCYNSSNIDRVRGRTYELVVCAGAPGAKWKANQAPDEDLRSLELLMSCLETVQAGHLVLISTVDVYPDSIGVDEATPIDPDAGAPYGRHRLMLERFVRERFDATTIRLPALFGTGLKKNIVYDLLNDNRVDRICPDSVFQFYPLDHLWKDVGVVREHGVPLVNFATEPVSVRQVAREGFGIEFENPDATQPARYDMRTRYAQLFGRKGSYMLHADEVLESLATYVASTGWVRP